MSSNAAKSRLTSLFPTNNTGVSPEEGGNASLRYTAPKESTMSRTAPATPTSRVIHSANVYLYKFNAASKSYAQHGTTAVGCAIIGAGTSYSLLCYNEQKQQICRSNLTSSFRCTLQINAYVNFYEDPGNFNWSLRFKDDTEAQLFIKHVALVKLHVGIWDPASSAKWAAATQPLLMMDVALGTTEGSIISSGDTVGVACSIWRIVGTAASSPEDLIAKQTPFETSSKSEMRRFRVGDGNERFKAMELGVVNMKKGTRRMIVSPPKLTGGTEWLLIEVEIIRSKSKSRSSGSAPAPTPSAPAVASTPAPAALVPYEPVPGTPQANEQETKQKQWEELELETQRKALEDARRQLMYEKLEAQRQQMQFPPQQQQQPYVPISDYRMPPSSYGIVPNFHQPPTSVGSAAGGNPTVLLDINAKVDHVIQLLNQNRSYGDAHRFGTGALDTVDAVNTAKRAIDRLGSENERSLQELSDRSRQMTSLESRMNQIAQQYSQSVQENRRLVDRMNEIQQQLTSSGEEIARAYSMKEVSMLQVSRLENELQQLRLGLDAQNQRKDENQEYERNARVRAEHNLQAEVQARALAEQQLAILEKQQDMDKQMLIAELQNEKQMELTGLQQRIQELEDYTAKARQRIQELLPFQEKLQEAQQIAHDALENAQAKTNEINNLRQELFNAQSSLQDTGTGGSFEEQRLKLEKSHQDELEQLRLAHQEELSKVPSGGGEEKLTKALEDAERMRQLLESDQRTVTEVFKETMNDVYFRFQDAFSDDDQLLSASDVMGTIRKVLKQSTKEVLNKLAVNPDDE